MNNPIPSPRWISAAEAYANFGEGGGNVVGPSSAVDGNLAVFDGITGKLIKDGGAPGGGGSFLSANTARVDPSSLGDDTGVFGDLTKPFLTVQGAINAIQAPQTSGLLVVGKTYQIMTYEAGDDFGNVNGTNQALNVFIASGTTPADWSHGSILEARPDWTVIDIGDNSFTEDLTTSLGSLIFVGRNSSPQIGTTALNSPFNSLRFLSNIVTDVVLILKDCNASGFTEAPDGVVNIGGDVLTSGSLVVGLEYVIDDYQDGDDFTNVGGTNVTGNVFVATGTTPTVWTNGSTIALDPQFVTVSLHLINARLKAFNFQAQINSNASVSCYGDAHSRLLNLQGNVLQPINLFDFRSSDGSEPNISSATSATLVNCVAGNVAASITDLFLYNSSVSGTNSAGETTNFLNPSLGSGVGANGPITVAFNRATAQNAANASIATATVGLFDASFEVSMNMNVSAATGISTSMKCDYTDENNVARSMILPVTGLTGSFLAGGLVVATGAFETPAMHIRCKAGTTITLYTATGTFTGVTYNAEGLIKQTQ